MDITYYVRYIFTFSVVLGILWVFLKFLQKYHKGQITGDMKIVDRMVLNSQVSLMIVKVRDHELLLSVSSKQTHVLKDLSC